MIIAEDSEIQLQHLPSRIAEPGKQVNTNQFKYITSLRNVVTEAEKKAIAEVLEFTKGNKVKAAKILGIHRTVLYQKIKRYNI